MTNGVPSEASDQELSEQLLSDCKQIIQQIADALPSPEDRTRFAKNLIQAALDEQGLQHAEVQMKKENHPLRHAMAQIHDFAKKNPPGYTMALIGMIVPALLPANVLGAGATTAPLPPSPPPHPALVQDQQATFLAQHRELAHEIVGQLSGEYDKLSPAQQLHYCVMLGFGFSPWSGLTSQQLTQVKGLTPQQENWLAARVSGELASRSAANSAPVSQHADIWNGLRLNLPQAASLWPDSPQVPILPPVDAQPDTAT